MEHHKALREYRRIVIKIGSALLVDPERGLRRDWLLSLCQDIASLRAAGVELLLVSSGAIAFGRILCDLLKSRLKLAESQACAAIGQIELSKAYAEFLGSFGLKTGQILLTFGDTEERGRYLNARGTIETLLKLGVIPVINENDTVATQEIRYGDNDRLAARVSTMVQADLLILLSDIDGLYTAPPQLDPEAKFLPFISAITPEIERMAGAAASSFSRGGMKTKLEAGKLANSAGTAMIISSGKCQNPLLAIEKGKRYSYFAPSQKPVNAWKSWISGQLVPSGTLVIDQGAIEALHCGKSLLAAGVKRFSGNFVCGDIVAIQNEEGQEIARGLIAYDKDDLAKILGLRREALEKDLVFPPTSVLIHRNDMVIRKV